MEKKNYKFDQKRTLSEKQLFSNYALQGKKMVTLVVLSEI